MRSDQTRTTLRQPEPAVYYYDFRVVSVPDWRLIVLNTSRRDLFDVQEKWLLTRLNESEAIGERVIIFCDFLTVHQTERIPQCHWHTVNRAPLSAGLQARCSPKYRE